MRRPSRAVCCERATRVDMFGTGGFLLGKRGCATPRRSRGREGRRVSQTTWVDYMIDRSGGSVTYDGFRPTKT